MIRVFVSYRRSDSRPQAGRLHDRLIQRFGGSRVFRDVDAMPLGSDFRTVLADQVAGCDVLLALIGDGWLSAVDDVGARRLDDPGDFVRFEVESALRRGVPVIPVLVGAAGMPEPEDLPEPLRELAYRQAARVRDDPDFHRDADRLIRGIELAVKRSWQDRKTRNSQPPRPRGRWRWLGLAIAPVMVFGFIQATTQGDPRQPGGGATDREIANVRALRMIAEVNSEKPRDAASARRSSSDSPEAEIILRVLREDNRIAGETIRAVGANASPSAYAEAIRRYLVRVQAMDTSDCPSDFRVAFRHHHDAWNELKRAVETLPNTPEESFAVGFLKGFLDNEKDGGLAIMKVNLRLAAENVKGTLAVVEEIGAEYGAALP